MDGFDYFQLAVDQARMLQLEHSAHVDAWMDADFCAYCGDRYATARRRDTPICKWCLEPLEREDRIQADHEERIYAAMVRRSQR